jgi:hypothetical protein
MIRANVKFALNLLDGDVAVVRVVTYCDHVDFSNGPVCPNYVGQQ